MGNQDPLLTALKEVGLSVVRLPRADIAPLTLLIKGHRALNVVGPIQEVFSGRDLPKIAVDQPAPAFRVQKTRAMSGALGVSLLKGWLSALGGKDAELAARLSGAKDLRFEFPDVLVDSIQAGPLDRYLSGAKLSHPSKAIASALEHRKVYVVTLGVKTRRFRMELGEGAKQDLGLTIPEIQGLVGGDIKVRGDARNGSLVEYQGDAPLYFGFRALRLFYRDGTYQGFRDAPLVMSGDSPRRRVWFTSDSPFTALGTDWDDLVE